MEILKNVQLLDDSYLAEVSGGVNLKGAQAKEGAAKFFTSPAGVIVAVGATVTTVALSVLGALFGSDLAAKGCSKLPDRWGLRRLRAWGTAYLESPVYHLYNSKNEEVDLEEGSYIALCPRAAASSKVDS